MRRLLLSCVVALLVLPAGCTTTQPSGPADAAPPLDSLRAANARLEARTRALQDSLQFYDDVDSGQYYRERRTLKDRLTRLIYEVRLLRDGGQTVSILPVDSLFAAPGTTLSPAGARRLKGLARQLQSTYPDRTIRVEGHADTTALGGALKERFDSNWELSAARATAVVRRLLTLTSLDRSQFVAVGYGDSRPRASNETAGGRRRNRRVRVAVLPLPKPSARPFELAW
jgi:chemotaxis protein MotB